MNWIEAIATVFGVVCVWLTIRRNIWCWPIGLVQVTLYIYIFYGAKLYSDMGLHIIYVFLQFYGWFHWLHGGKNREELPISLLYQDLFVWVGFGLISSVICGYLMWRFTDATAPYADAFIAVLSLIAQWLMAQKKLESWYFWIAVDIVAIGVYWYKELYLTTGLYTIFFVLAIIGFLEWRKAFLKNPKPIVAGVTI